MGFSKCWTMHFTKQCVLSAEMYKRTWSWTSGKTSIKVKHSHSRAALALLYFFASKYIRTFTLRCSSIVKSNFSFSSWELQPVTGITIDPWKLRTYPFHVIRWKYFSTTNTFWQLREGQEKDSSKPAVRAFHFCSLYSSSVKCFRTPYD